MSLSSLLLVNDQIVLYKSFLWCLGFKSAFSIKGKAILLGSLWGVYCPQTQGDCPVLTCWRSSLFSHLILTVCSGKYYVLWGWRCFGNGRGMHVLVKEDSILSRKASNSLQISFKWGFKSGIPLSASLFLFSQSQEHGLEKQTSAGNFKHIKTCGAFWNPERDFSTFGVSNINICFEICSYYFWRVLLGLMFSNHQRNAHLFSNRNTHQLVFLLTPLLPSSTHTHF